MPWVTDLSKRWMGRMKNDLPSIPLPIKYRRTLDLQYLVLFGRVTACILPTHKSLRQNASGPGYPLYLLWSLGPQKDAASTPHAMCCSEIGSLKGKSIFITRSAHSPAFHEKLHSGKRASLQKVLDTIPTFYFSFR